MTRNPLSLGISRCFPFIALAGFALAMPRANADIPKSSSATQQREFIEAPSSIRGVSDESFSNNEKAAWKQEAIVKYFHLINETGAEIKVRLLEDGRELFVKQIQGKLNKSEGIVHPAEGQYPTLTLKIGLNKQARRLSIQESLVLKKRKTFVMSAASDKEDAGFQIVIRKDGIKVTQDYYPIL